MKMPKAFTKEVLIRLEGGDGFISTVRYGWFCSISEAFRLGGPSSLHDRPATASAEPKDAVPINVPLRKRSTA